MAIRSTASMLMSSTFVGGDLGVLNARGKHENGLELRCKATRTRCGLQSKQPERKSAAAKARHQTGMPKVALQEHPAASATVLEQLVEADAAPAGHLRVEVLPQQSPHVTVLEQLVEAEASPARHLRVEVLPQQSLRRPSGMQTMLAGVLDMAEKYVVPLVEPREKTLRTDPRIQLEGNFAPVEESPPTRALEVKGTIPACLNGAYIRNGGNPKFQPTGGFHYFDGDGMLHVVRIKDGTATHCCRFTRTNRLVHEERAGRPLFTKALGELEGLGGVARLALLQLRGMVGVADLSQGMGAANAGLEYFNGMLLAMSEDDMPYAIRVTDDGDVGTVGRYNFGGGLKSSMTAHPKIDPKTGEMFSLSYDVMKQPYMTYFRVAPNGKKGEGVPITLPEPTVIHDFAITEHYAIFPEGQVVFRLQELFNGKSPIFCDEKKVPRFGVLPRNARSEASMRWFELPGVTCFHYVNAWEEGDEIILVGSAISPLSYLFDRPSELENRLCRFRLNMRTGKACKEQISDANLDVGRCNTLYTGRKTRFAYMSMAGPWPKFSGIAKVDLDSRLPNGRDGIVGWRKFAPGCFNSEPYFVPRSQEGDVAEDDGYVVTHYHDENTGVSELLVMDARSPTLETVASIRMPGRVPYGFHGIFLTEEQLARQRSFPAGAALPL